MAIKQTFYQLDKKDFDNWLDYLKYQNDTLIFFENTSKSYFYYESAKINEKVLELNKKQWIFDLLFNSFSKFGQRQLLQSFLIDEIKATNEIEKINSTRHDIFYLLNNSEINNNQKIRSITNAYSYLLNKAPYSISDNKQIREIYDCLFVDDLKQKDKPDGKYFRKNIVYINDGIENVHQGFYPESLINETMDEFINMYNRKKESYVKNIICHFMIETIHPFYDGNGRLGRFLFSNGLLKDTNSYFALLISKAISKNKNKYYKAFEVPRDIHEFGCINDYVEMMIDILLESIESEIKKLNEYILKININIDEVLTKNELIIYKLLNEASILSYYGVSNKELIEYSGISKRSLITIMNKFKEKGLLIDTRIGKTTYHKI